MKPVLYLCLGASLLNFILMGVDKRRAKTGAWRIAEKWFFLIALAGGMPGAILGIYAFRHKTLHRRFTWGMPAILILQLLALWFHREYGIQLL